MRKVLLLLLMFFITVFAEQIEGVFKLPNGIYIEIYKNGDTYEGKIVALNGYREKDIKNPNKTQREKFLIGKIILNSLKFCPKDNTYKDGKMYSTDKGIVVNLKITKVTDNELSAIGSKLIIKKSMPFKRVK